MTGAVAARRSSVEVHITARRSSGGRRYRLWAEVDGDFGVVLARSRTLAGLRRNAARAIRQEWKLGHLGETGGALPVIVWHRSTRRYARLARREWDELRRRLRESERTARRIERRLRRAGAYAQEARFIARGQVYLELDIARSRRLGRLEVAQGNP